MKKSVVAALSNNVYANAIKKSDMFSNIITG